ncbi:helix-turn-helix domain-containing protein [Sulfitobacter faviae]|uniref:helix-turn-helix domain-containing protein n=1 Tax=Sulfitobacter faviae TaxID=1775881 RepID=UPI0024578D51|nr:helix-turn-helix domain-containing protein [Sulfitobacter faviae]
MAEHAAALGVTPTHLTRAVKAATGKSAADLLTERSCHAARRLLAETDHTAAEIAATLGFGSAAYFTRFMQQHSGLPPANCAESRAEMSLSDPQHVAKTQPNSSAEC